ncbi:O-antigen ligase family protein [Acinetobacter sp. ANC 3813]|uniref:O-antigen ligase family protein n=1 Tax=Acinetobacter sp. ANC 3813 TaxID=1977873 RepID=UPI000A336479|nr:O-antigen ligase family protein [Acinetobacter sp. ANC 3813]OTG89694.1 hypothetical protein B9T34_10805 [Acinetobacter sp. ANC 3813]
MLNSLKIKLSNDDLYFFIFCICTFFLSFGSSGASIENSIQGIFYLLFSIPIILRNIKKIKFHKNYTLILLGLFFCISTVYSITYYYIESWLRVVNLTSLLLLYCSIFLFFRSKKEYIIIFFNILIFIGLIHIFSIITDIIIFNRIENTNLSTSFPFGNIRHISSFLTVIFIISLYLSLNSKQKINIFYKFTAIIFLSFILWSGSRSSYISLFIVLLYLFYFSEEKIQYISNTTQILLSSIAISLLLSVKNNIFGVQRIQNYSSSGRTEIWLETINHIINKPFIGYGADSFSLIMNNYGRNYYQAHNFILQILIEFGVIGFILIIFNLYKYGKNINTNINSDQKLFIAILINYFLIGLFDGVVYYTFSLFFIGFSFSILRINYTEKII